MTTEKQTGLFDQVSRLHHLATKAIELTQIIGGHGAQQQGETPEPASYIERVATELEDLEDRLGYLVKRLDCIRDVFLGDEHGEAVPETRVMSSADGRYKWEEVTG